MRLLEINVVCGVKSTGRIATEIAKEYEQKGYEVKIAYGREDVPKEYQKYAVRIGSKFSVYYHAFVSRILDNAGFLSKRATKKFLEWADEYNPDVLWLHNLHGYYINIEMLFDWIKLRPNMEVKWTLHDCWAFTGHCTHFMMAGCNKWQEECFNCPKKLDYPKSIFLDKSKENFQKKKVLFSDIKNLTIYTPSEWLKSKVKKSFLKENEVIVLPNAIDKNLFRPVASVFRKEHGISEDKKLLVSVATAWTKSKGLDDLIELSKRLDNSKYSVMAVGLSKKQLKTLPGSIKGIGLVNVDELVKIYSAADLLISTSKEETFGLTILEAAACGTKAIVYKDTACEEVALSCGGRAVDMSVDAMYGAIIEEQ